MTVGATLKAAARGATYCAFLGGFVIWAVANTMRVRTAPNEKDFFVDDRQLGLPHKEETVDYNWVLVCIIPTWLLVVALEAGVARRWHRNAAVAAQACLQGALMLLAGFCFVFALTEVSKIHLGQLRPDFLDRCRPEEPADAGVAGNYACTGTDEELIKAGRKSFPSGHTSSAFYLAGFAMAYILSFAFTRDWRAWGARRAAVPALDPAGPTPKWRRDLLDGVAVVSSFLVLVPAAYVGNTRILDHRHHAWDVAGGALIGLVGGFATVAALQAENRNAAAAAIKRASDVHVHDDSGNEPPVAGSSSAEAVELVA